MELKSAGLRELAGKLRTGELEAVTLVRACLGVIEQHDPEIQAWAHLAAEAALEQASGPQHGPLFGLPFGVKDIFDTAGLATEYGSPLFRDRTPGKDAELVAQLRSLGGIVLGKTHTTAFAYYDPGPARNPVAPERTPGGSSSGSAAAVAAGMAPFALGSQTQGSVLRPASFCGVTGFKPSYGALSLTGVLPFAPTLDHAGYFTRTAADAAFLWEALGGERGEAPDAPLAAPRWPIEGALEPAMKDGFARMLERLQRAGFEIETVDLPDEFRELPEAIYDVMAREAADVHRELFERHGEAVGEKLARLLEAGLGISESAYDHARGAMVRAREAFAEWSKQHPITVTPAALGPAPRGLASTGDPRANAPWTALGAPAIAIPGTATHDGLPLGMQISAAPSRDGALLSAARRIEIALQGQAESLC